MNKLFNYTVRTLILFRLLCYFELFLGGDIYENARNNRALVCVV
jgi:hypothetical protein